MPVSRRLRNVNVLYLISMVLILAAGSFMQSRSFGWGLVGTELLLILLPALVYVFKIDPAAKGNLRWRWPGGKYVLAGLLIGAGLPFASVILNGISAAILGYVVGVQPEFYFVDGGQGILLFVGMVILAPLCEEILFRGVIQPAYEARSPRFAIVAVGLMFAFIHMRFQGLLPLLPVAFALGYVVHRGNSLFIGIAVHLGFNAVSMSTNLAFSRSPDSWPLLALAVIVGGLISFVVGFIMLPSRTGKDEEPVAVTAPDAKRAVGKFAIAWPLIVAMAVYGVMAGFEYVTFGNHDIIARPEIQLLPMDDVPAQLLSYDVQDRFGHRIGAATYTVEQQGDLVRVDWVVQHDAFRNEIGNRSVYMSGGAEAGGSSLWEAATGRVVFIEARSNEMIWTLTDDGAMLHVTVDPGDGHPYPPMVIPDNVLLKDEWPWRLSGIPFAVGYRAAVALFSPLKWNSAVGKSIPLLEHKSVKVMGGTPVSTPAGVFVTWEVSLGGDQTVWYDTQWPHRVVRYDDGIVMYVLADWQ